MIVERFVLYLRCECCGQSYVAPYGLAVDECVCSSCGTPLELIELWDLVQQRSPSWWREVQSYATA